MLGDRFLFTWCSGASGALKLDCDVLLAIVLLPSFLILAAQGVVWSVGSFSALFLTILALEIRSVRSQPRSRFFLSWSVSSLTFLVGVFQMQVVPFLEIVVLENIFLMSLITGMLACVWKIKTNSSLLEPGSSFRNKTDPEDVSVVDVGHPPSSVCNTCNNVQPARSSHCIRCGCCVLKMDHHSVWVDCCIGARNHAWYLLTLVLMTIAATYGANLTLTTLCQPVLVAWDLLLVPYDCSDVYSAFNISICFVSAVYALLIAFCGLVGILHQAIFISFNVTWQEWCNRHRGTRMWNCCVPLRSDYSLGYWRNWIQFCRRGY